jgi:hypothetical protein
MGRKHKRPRVVVWTFDDECAMLAFLEFRIGQGETDRVRHIQAIVQHLSENRAKTFTVSQVEEKLIEIQNQAVRKARKGTIFSEGLKVLSRFPHEENVGRLKQQLVDEYLANMIRSEKRQLRSDSRGLDSSSQSRPRRRHLVPAEIPESPSPHGTVSEYRRSRLNLPAREDTSPLAKRRLFADKVWVLISPPPNSTACV